MNAIERRAEIMRILLVRRRETMQVLAKEFGVTDRTIRNDITALTAKYPLQTSRGVGGGVFLPKSFYPHPIILPMEVIIVIKELIPMANKHQQEVLKNFLAASTYKQE